MNITLNQIGKKYGKTWIFRKISAEFTPNHIYGITGYNGSGKSTLLQTISGYITPNEGEVAYNSGELDVEEVYKHCCISAPYLELPGELTVVETIQIHFQFKSYKGQLNKEKILAEIDLTDHKNKPLSQLSSGMLQRLKLALALFTDSELLLLDEPCANLDSTWSEWFNKCLLEQADDRIVIICSNDENMELKHASEPYLNVSNFRS